MIFCIYCCSARDDAVDLEQREPVFSSWMMHPQATWRNHQQVQAAARSAKLNEELTIAGGSPDGYVLV
jgi:hypothetical protein